MNFISLKEKDFKTVTNQREMMDMFYVDVKYQDIYSAIDKSLYLEVLQENGSKITKQGWILEAP